MFCFFFNFCLFAVTLKGKALLFFFFLQISHNYINLQPFYFQDCHKNTFFVFDLWKMSKYMQNGGQNWTKFLLHFFVLTYTSNSLIVPVHVHPSFGQTAAKASTSLRAALSGKAYIAKWRLITRLENVCICKTNYAFFSFFFVLFFFTVVVFYSDMVIQWLEFTFSIPYICVAQAAIKLNTFSSTNYCQYS